MQQYFYSKPLHHQDEIHLSKEDNYHILKVMRLKLGQEVEIVDSQGQSFIGTLLDIIDALPTFRVRENLNAVKKELPVQVTIACGLSKNDKLDWIVQKGTECGMIELIPLSLRRDVVKWDGKKADKRIERLEKIAKEAAEQSHRQFIPLISPLMSLKELVNRDGYDYLMVAYEEQAKSGSHYQFKEILSQINPGSKLLIVFGSEGGLAEEEIALLVENNFVKCSLGPRILRAETAPIYALSAISYHFEL